MDENIETFETESAAALMKFLSTNPADVILMDINMPEVSGIEATKLVKEQYPDTNVIAVSMYQEDKYVIEMLKAGALGYLLKSTGIDELVEAIKVVARGDSYFCKEASTAIFLQLDKTKKEHKQKTGDSNPLTEREIEVLKLIAQGFTNKEIAEKLFISVRTVDTHRTNIHQKLNINNTAGLVNYAIKQGLLS
jgi:DNA-binding NarL/FixJ family response regulator